MGEDTDWENYQTGPFCRHWSDPSDCDEVCATCGHKCTEHDFEAPGECMVDGCKCKAFADKNETPNADVTGLAPGKDEQ